MTNPPMTLKQAITAHFIIHWGVPREILKQEPGASDLAVLEFPPRMERKTFRFATNGMSASVQLSEVTRNSYRTELYACSRSNAPWIIELMVALARYPKLHQTALGEFDTVPLARPIVRVASRFTALLIAPPGPAEAETLGALPEVSPEPVLVHEVVAITAKELDFALEHGSERLWEKLLGLGQPLLVDEARPEAVR